MEQEIDILVYKLYNLTWEEVKIIDPEIETKTDENGEKMTEGKYNNLDYHFEVAENICEVKKEDKKEAKKVTPRKGRNYKVEDLGDFE